MVVKSGEIEVKSRSSRFADVLAAARANESKIIAGHTPKKKSPSAGKSLHTSGDDVLRTSRLGLGAVPKKETQAEVLQSKLGKKIKTSMKRKRGAADEDIDNEDNNVRSDAETEDVESTRTAFKTRHKPKLNPLDSILEEKEKRKASAARKRQKKALKAMAIEGDFEEIDDSAFASNWTDDSTGEVKSQEDESNVFGSPMAVTTPKLNHLNKSRVKGPRGRHLPSGISTAAPKSRHIQTLNNADTTSSTTDDVASVTAGQERGAAKELSATAGNSDTPQDFIALAGLPAKSSETDPGDADDKKKKSKWRIRPKRPKVRSKQKNIKKDNRPDHLKPSYLTPGAKDYKEKKPIYRKGSTKFNANEK